MENTELPQQEMPSDNSTTFILCLGCLFYIMSTLAAFYNFGVVAGFIFLSVPIIFMCITFGILRVIDMARGRSVAVSGINELGVTYQPVSLLDTDSKEEEA